MDSKPGRRGNDCHRCLHANGHRSMTKHNEAFLQTLKDKGLFIRDYDEPGTERLIRAVSDLHRELCKYDQSNIRPWKEVTVLELLDAYAENQNLAILGDRA